MFGIPLVLFKVTTTHSACVHDRTSMWVTIIFTNYSLLLLTISFRYNIYDTWTSRLSISFLHGRRSRNEIACNTIILSLRVSCSDVDVFYLPLLLYLQTRVMIHVTTAAACSTLADCQLITTILIRPAFQLHIYNHYHNKELKAV